MFRGLVSGRGLLQTCRGRLQWEVEGVLRKQFLGWEFNFAL